MVAGVIHQLPHQGLSQAGALQPRVDRDVAHR